MTHTPGPWSLTESVNDTQDAPFKEWVVEDATGDIVGVFRNEEHARLIAAAPDLLDVLETLEIVCLAFADFQKSQTCCKVLREARAAINKAKGV